MTGLRTWWRQLWCRYHAWQLRDGRPTCMWCHTPASPDDRRAMAAVGLSWLPKQPDPDTCWWPADGQAPSQRPGAPAILEGPVCGLPTHGQLAYSPPGIRVYNIPVCALHALDAAAAGCWITTPGQDTGLPDRPGMDHAVDHHQDDQHAAAEAWPPC